MAQASQAAIDAAKLIKTKAEGLLDEYARILRGRGHTVQSAPLYGSLNNAIHAMDGSLIAPVDATELTQATSTLVSFMDQVQTAIRSGGGLP